MNQEIINNGTTVWTYLPSAKEVNIDNFDAQSDDINPVKIFDIYKKGFKYLYLGEKTEGGVVHEEIDLVPEKKNAQYFKIKMTHGVHRNFRCFDIGLADIQVVYPDAFSFCCLGIRHQFSYWRSRH